MQFQHVEARRCGAQCRKPEVFTKRNHVAFRQLTRHEPALFHRNRTGRHDLPRPIPPRMIVRRERRIAEPGPLHARLAPRMGELDRRHRAVVAQKRRDPRKRSDLVIMPYAEIAVGDAAFGNHSGGLRHHDSGAALREFPEMHQVPVVRHAVIRRVLAHRRYDDAVF